MQIINTKYVIMNNSKKILIVGSSNTDMVVKTSHIPIPGETILGGAFMMNPGGKGANQAVAVARLEGNVSFICKIGKDIFGQQTREQFRKEGIDTKYVFEDEKSSSGVALITVDEKGENCITVAPGANMQLEINDIKQSNEAIASSDLVLMQLEIPMETVEYVAEQAASSGKKVILNPAPACELSEKLLKSLYLITPNETEAEIISGQKVTDFESAKNAAQIIRSKGVRNVIITMGASGCFIYTDDLCEIVPAYRVEAVDTTAAGDIFNGALVVALSEGKGWKEAIEFGNRTSAISVTRMGAQASAPKREEVDCAEF